MCKDRHSPSDGSCHQAHMDNMDNMDYDVGDLGSETANQFDEIARPVGGLDSIQNSTYAEVKARNEGLARLLKKGTSRSHRAAENVHFVRDFMQHKVSVDSYTELLGALFHVYSALEEALDRCSKIDSRVRAIHFPSLARSASLLEDLEYFHGDNYAALATALENPSPVAKQYVDRLREIGTSQPLLLVAHSYTRYLGDLSGGQLLAKAAVKAFKLSEADGTSFYHFKAVPNAHTFKDEYRLVLDGLRICQDEADDLVSEANLAFIHNMRLFQERDVAVGYITAVQSVEDAMLLVSQAKSALSFQNGYAELGGKPDAAAQCPFLPRKQSSGSQKIHDKACKCPMMSFASFFLPERVGVKLVANLVLLGSLLIGTALRRSFPLKKLA